MTFDVTLERRIRELCAHAAAAKDMDELQPVLRELREALRTHVIQLHGLVANYPFSPADTGKVVSLNDRARGKVNEKKEKAS